MKRNPADPLAGTKSLATLGDWWDFALALYERENLSLGQIATNAADESLYLLLHTLGWPLDSPRSALRRKIHPGQATELRELLRCRALEKIPAAYLTREAWLGAEKFYVDERVLIPRSYFLEIIPEQLDAWIEEPRLVRRVADVGTGSGCLAILLAKHFRRAEVDAVDVSAAALAVAAINIRRHRLDARISLRQSDLFSAVPLAKYDVILSNPPYEPTPRVEAMPREFHREPRSALDGGVDGMDIVRRLIAQAPKRLAPRGILIIEVGGLRPLIEREFGRFEPNWLPTHDGTNGVVLFQAEHLRRELLAGPTRSRARRTRIKNRPGAGRSVEK